MDYDELLSDSDTEEATNLRKGDAHTVVAPTTCTERWCFNTRDALVALWPVFDGGDALLHALASFRRRNFFIFVVVAAVCLSSTCFTGCAASAHSALLGRALPCLWRNALWSGLTAALLPVAVGNALILMRRFPIMKESELPPSGLWLGQPAPLAVLLPVLAFVPSACMMACTWLLLNGAGATTPIYAQFVAFDALERALVVGLAVVISVVASWTTVVRLSLTKEADDILCT